MGDFVLSLNRPFVLFQMQSQFIIGLGDDIKSLNLLLVLFHYEISLADLGHSFTSCNAALPATSEVAIRGTQIGLRVILGVPIKFG